MFCVKNKTKLPDLTVPLCMLILPPMSSPITTQDTLLFKIVTTIFRITRPYLKNASVLSIKKCSTESKALLKSTHSTPIFSHVDQDWEMLSTILIVQLLIFLKFRKPFCPCPIFFYKYVSNLPATAPLISLYPPHNSVIGLQSSTLFASPFFRIIFIRPVLKVGESSPSSNDSLAHLVKRGPIYSQYFFIQPVRFPVPPARPVHVRFIQCNR